MSQLIIMGVNCVQDADTKKFIKNLSASFNNCVYANITIRKARFSRERPLLAEIEKSLFVLLKSSCPCLILVIAKHLVSESC